MNIPSVSGVSNFSVQNNQNLVNTQQPGSTTTTTTSPTTLTVTGLNIYGGIAGVKCSGGGSGLCNSCDPTVTTTCKNSAGVDQFPLCACNQQRIMDSTIITINVQQQMSYGGTVHIVGPSSTTTNTTIPNTNGIGNDLGGSTPAVGSVSFPWSSICLAMGAATATCEGIGAKTISLQLWVDNNPTISGGNQYLNSPNTDDLLTVQFQTLLPSVDENTYDPALAAEGVGQFTAYPGDTRIYITNVNTPSGFPNLAGDGSTAVNATVVASTTNLNAAFLGSAGIVSGQTGISGNSLTNPYIDGVQNDVGYYTRIAMMDQANNILQYYPNLTVPPACNGIGNPITDCVDFYVIPDAVLALLDKDLNCFVATAAYGSPMEPKIGVFREFRKRFLLTHKWGKHFVMDYYKYGPYAARFIVDKPVFRFMARGLLWPAWGFSLIALRFGIAQAIASVVAILLLIGALTVMVRRQFARD